MSAPALQRLDLSAFLAFANSHEGKWELFDGAAVAMSPERVWHTETKIETALALRQAIRSAGAPCRAYTEGITVRVREDRAFVPDALVVCPPAPRQAVVIDRGHFDAHMAWRRLAAGPAGARPASHRSVWARRRGRPDRRPVAAGTLALAARSRLAAPAISS
jgi:hypothetical protein